MDINDISEYFMLHLFGQRNSQAFCEQENIYSRAIVYNLLKVHYFIYTKNSCWTKDIIDCLKDSPKQSKKVEIGMYFLSQGRYVAEQERDKVLGKRWELTNKGTYLLNRYAAWLREEQRKLNYKIKESHKESRELKENN